MDELTENRKSILPLRNGNQFDLLSVRKPAVVPEPVAESFVPLDPVEDAVHVPPPPIPLVSFSDGESNDWYIVLVLV